MSTITLQEAQSTLAELVHRLAPGEGVTITENDRPVAQSHRPTCCRHSSAPTAASRDRGAESGKL